MELNYYETEGDKLCQWRYWSVVERRHSSDAGWYDTYGILAVTRIRSWLKVHDVVHDVTTDCGAARKMAEMFTAFCLSPIHLMDAIEDMLP